jgi:hypothetical protein
MNKLSRGIGSIGALFLLGSCQQGPAAAALPMTGTSGPITVTVTAPPPNWVYTVTPAAPATFAYVEFVASINHTKCRGSHASGSIWVYSLTPDSGATSFGHQVFGQNTPERFTLTCPEITGTGPLYVIVYGSSGGTRFRRVIGPLAGPTEP